MLINPILASSARRRMRSWKTPLAILIFGAVLLWIALATALMPLMNDFMTISAARSGLDSYIYLICAEFALITLVAPAMTAGSIAGERERQTLEMLLVTNVGSFRIAMGKLLESLGYLAFLILAILPFNCCILAYGSVGLSNVLRTALFLLITAYGAASIGLFCSSLFRKTVTATIAAYIIVLAVGLFTLLPAGFQDPSVFYDLNLNRLSQRELVALVPPTLFINPALGLLNLLAGQSGSLSNTLSYSVPFMNYSLGQTFLLMGYDFFANVTMIGMACAATVFTLLSGLFVRPRLRIRRQRK